MDDVALIESHALRKQFCTEENTSVLEHIGTLITLPECGFTTKENVANFYQVGLGTIDSLTKRHQDELKDDGYKVLSKKDFQNLHDASFKISNRGLAIYPKRAVLRVGMLLRDSVVAKLVRTYLLNTYQQNHTSLENHQILMEMANVLNQQAEQISQNATQLAEHSNFIEQNSSQLASTVSQLRRTAEQSDKNAKQLLSQANLVKAIVEEVYNNRREIRQNTESIKKLELRFSLLKEELKQVPPPTNIEYISEEQIKILKARVKEKGSSSEVWWKLKQHFGVTRYIFLPKSRFREVLDWLEQF
jgi:hypothetical protein